MVLPAYDATGVGAKAGSVTSLSWSHTISGNAIIVSLIALRASTTPPTVTVTVGGTGATQLGSVADYWPDGTGNFAHLFLFGLLNPPTGSNTVAVSSSASLVSCGGNSVSYKGVAGFGTAVTNTGTSTSGSLSISSTPGQMVAALFSDTTLTSISSFNQTQRFLQAFASGQSLLYLLGDAPGASTVTLTTTFGSSTTWAGIGVPLL
jgi:hypothetical protein